MYAGGIAHKVVNESQWLTRGEAASERCYDLYSRNASEKGRNPEGKKQEKRKEGKSGKSATGEVFSLALLAGGQRGGFVRCGCRSTSAGRRREAQHASSAEVSMYRRRVEQLAAPGESPVSQVKGGKGKLGFGWVGQRSGQRGRKSSIQPQSCGRTRPRG